MKAAIYPLKDVHIKIYKAYGHDCLKEYVKLINYSLDQVESASFKKKMFEAIGHVIKQSSVLKTIIQQLNMPSEKTD